MDRTISSFRIALAREEKENWKPFAMLWTNLIENEVF
jgi:hypothetical protein